LKGKVNITVTPFDYQKFYLGMDFLDRAKDFIVPHANTLFIMGDGQTQAIPMRREAKEERELSALQFSRNGELGYLATLKRDEGSTCVMPRTIPRKITLRTR